MRVLTKAHGRRNDVIVEHTKRTKMHAIAIKPGSKTKRVVSLQPTMVGVAAVKGFANSDHDA